MVLDQLRKKSDNNAAPENLNQGAAILIVEDDSEQMDMFVSFTVAELKRLLNEATATAEQRKKLTPFNILRVSEMKSLEQAVTTHDDVIVAILDCNIPDAKGAAPHDQFVKKDNNKVTGQHKSVDLIAQHLPGTPIVLISSMRRFQRTITRFYAAQSELQLEFISKDDISIIREKINHHLRAYAGHGG